MDKHDGEHHQHHILSGKIAIRVWLLLLVGTVLTVAVARVNLGILNFPVAMTVATAKALLVILFFMGLKYDELLNRVIFATSFVFVAIFLVLTFSDTLFRGDFRVQGPLFAPIAGKPKFEKAWIPTAEIMANGKQVFQVQCASCHGATGHGDGPAASALNPKPRNFTAAEGWKNGRKATQVFQTLTKGLNAMPSFGTMPPDDRWSVTHYILSLGSPVATVTEADLKEIGIDPAKGGGGEEGKAIPVELAIRLMAEGK